MVTSCLLIKFSPNCSGYKNANIRIIHKLDENANIGIFVFTDKLLRPVGIEPGPLINPRFHPFSANWAFAYKTESLGSLYNRALLMHEHKFKDLVSSTCSLVQKGDSEIRL